MDPPAIFSGFSGHFGVNSLILHADAGQRVFSSMGMVPSSYPGNYMYHVHSLNSSVYYVIFLKNTLC